MRKIFFISITLSILFSNDIQTLYKQHKYLKLIKELNKYKNNNVVKAYKAKILFKLHKYNESKRIIKALLKEDIPNNVKQELKQYLNKIIFHIQTSAGINFQKDTSQKIGLKYDLLIFNHTKINNINSFNNAQLEYKSFFNKELENFTLFTLKSKNKLNNKEFSIKFQKYFNTIKTNKNLLSFNIGYNKKINYINSKTSLYYKIINTNKFTLNEYGIDLLLQKQFYNQIFSFSLTPFIDSNYMNSKNLKYEIKYNLNLPNNDSLFINYKLIQTLLKKRKYTHILYITHRAKISKHLFIQTSYQIYFKTDKDSILNYELSSNILFKY